MDCFSADRKALRVFGNDFCCGTGWVDSAILYFKYLERALAQLPADDECAEVLLRSADIFERYCAAHGLSRIAPLRGDSLVPGGHQVQGEESTGQLQRGQIVRCLEWGYRFGREVIKLARVIIAGDPLPALEAIVDEIIPLVEHQDSQIPEVTPTETEPVDQPFW